MTWDDERSTLPAWARDHPESHDFLALAKRGGKETGLIDKIPRTMLQAYGIFEKGYWAAGIALKG